VTLPTSTLAHVTPLETCIYRRTQLTSVVERESDNIYESRTHTAPIYPMNVQRMSFWNIAIIIRYPESQLSNGYPGDVQVSTCVRSYGRNGNILKYGSEKYVIVPLLYNENELF